MGKRVLVIDDDPNIRSILEAMLQADGYEVVLAEDGLQGVEILDKEPRPLNIALIVCDVVMPGMNGLDVVTRLKLHTHTQNIPVIMLTGEDKASDIMSGYSVGADYYITKPFNRQQLMKGIDIVLNGVVE